MEVRITNGELPPQEVEQYVKRAYERYPYAKMRALDIFVDGDYVELKYHFDEEPFQRIRRITGYLVGTTDRFNNAKKAEEKDRVKHG